MKRPGSRPGISSLATIPTTRPNRIQPSTPNIANPPSAEGATVRPHRGRVISRSPQECVDGSRSARRWRRRTCRSSSGDDGQRLFFSILQGSREQEALMKTDTDHRVAERTRALEAAVQEEQAAREHVVNLLRKVVTAQEDERGRIARNLHDQLGERRNRLRLALGQGQKQHWGEASPR